MRLQWPLFLTKPEPEVPRTPARPEYNIRQCPDEGQLNFDTTYTNKIKNVMMANKLPVSYRPALGRVGLWIVLEMDWPPQPIHSCAPGQLYLLSESSLSYVYAVGKQPASNC
ncbi:hypothetical protein TIFTF001_043670 [Ficus carica]|uniref:Uncharacterized protein n=1 Tax=Ficus carica TaxID=3494 RepID=A0AA87Z1H0_FICCA|nr:hypothetical protein TIFTF001_043670 [Ficus carica]